MKGGATFPSKRLLREEPGEYSLKARDNRGNNADPPRGTRERVSGVPTPYRPGPHVGMYVASETTDAEPHRTEQNVRSVQILPQHVGGS